MTIPLTVVVKSFRRPYLLGLCLESLRRFWPRDLPVLVADDGTDPLIIDRIYGDFGHLYTRFFDNPRAAGKWALARAGRFSEVAHTCGETWNAAMAAVETEHVFVIEDDSRLVRPDDPSKHVDLLERNPALLCVIGLRQRVELEARGFGVLQSEGATYHFFTHPYWPWSFDSIFFRRSDWARIGPWPVGLSTGAMESWLQVRLAGEHDLERPYAVVKEPLTEMDQGTRVRVDRPDPAAGASMGNVYAQADACLRAWYERRWQPRLDDVLATGRVVYPEGLRLEDWR